MYYYYTDTLVVVVFDRLGNTYYILLCFHEFQTRIHAYTGKSENGIKHIREGWVVDGANVFRARNVIIIII